MYSLDQMRAANPERFSSADYVGYAFGEFAHAKDLGESLAEVVWPELAELDGKVLIKSTGAVERYREHASRNVPPDEAQYWANLLLVDELFGIESEEAAGRMARAICAAWTARIAAEFPHSGAIVEVLRDEGAHVVSVRSIWPR